MGTVFPFLRSLRFQNLVGLKLPVKHILELFLFFQNSLKFPDDLTISDDAKDLIRRLLSDRKERIGYEGLANHGFFKGIDWTTMKDGKSFASL